MIKGNARIILDSGESGRERIAEIKVKCIYQCRVSKRNMIGNGSNNIVQGLASRYMIFIYRVIFIGPYHGTSEPFSLLGRKTKKPR
jgi:hypothetical protein